MDASFGGHISAGNLLFGPETKYPAYALTSLAGQVVVADGHMVSIQHGLYQCINLSAKLFYF